LWLANRALENEPRRGDRTTTRARKGTWVDRRASCKINDLTFITDEVINAARKRNLRRHYDYGTKNSQKAGRFDRPVVLASIKNQRL
jgi:hypothetical protein